MIKYILAQLISVFMVTLPMIKYVLAQLHDISLHGNVAYEGYNHEQDPADYHQYERLDEYNTKVSMVAIWHVFSLTALLCLFFML